MKFLYVFFILFICCGCNKNSELEYYDCPDSYSSFYSKGASGDLRDNILISPSEYIFILYMEDGSEFNDFSMSLLYTVFNDTVSTEAMTNLYDYERRKYPAITSSIKDKSKIKKLLRDVKKNKALKLQCITGYDHAYPMVHVEISMKNKKNSFKFSHKQGKRAGKNYSYFGEIFEDTAYFPIPLSRLLADREHILDSLVEAEKRGL
jgi:hypothetical protein